MILAGFAVACEAKYCTALAPREVGVGPVRTTANWLDFRASLRVQSGGRTCLPSNGGGEGIDDLLASSVETVFCRHLA